MISAILLMLPASGSVLAGDDYTYVVRTDPNSIRIDDGSVSVDNGFHSLTPGAPSIDYRIIKLALPPGMAVSGYAIEIAEPIVICSARLDFVVGDIKTGDYPVDTASAPDPAIFNSDDIFPHKRIEILERGNWGEANLISLAVYPVGYRPLSGKVLLYPEITVKFHL
jgi:hypothetical protein